MTRRMPEFLAIPLVIVLLGSVFVVMLVADAGTAAIVAFSVVASVALVAVAVAAMRRPRGSILGGSTVFEGGAPPLADGIHRVLLVTDSASAAADLGLLAADGTASRTVVFVVVPAVSSRTARWTGDEHAYGDAKAHLDSTLQALSDLGVQATGQVGAHDPLQATDDGLREFPAAEVVFALGGNGKSEWLEQGVVETGRRRYAVPVRELNANKRRDGR